LSPEGCTARDSLSMVSRSSRKRTRDTAWSYAPLGLGVQEPALEPLDLALEPPQALGEIEDHGDAGEIDADIAAEALDGAHARHSLDAEEQLLTGALAGLQQPEL